MMIRHDTSLPLPLFEGFRKSWASSIGKRPTIFTSLPASIWRALMMLSR